VQSAGHWRAGRLLNLSEGGAFITLDADLWVGEEIELVLGLPEKTGGRRALRALAVWRTIHEEPGRSKVTAGYGLLFPPQADAGADLSQILRRLEENGMAERSSRSSPDG
jgi:Tfp pilus assembly protein PilZ